MYLHIVLHSLCIIQILTFFNARSNLGAQGGFTCGPLHNQKAWLYIAYIWIPGVLLCYLLLSQMDELPKVKEGTEKSSSQRSMRVFESPGFWSQSNGA